MDPLYQDVGDPITNLIEELSEAIQALCKAKRFGINSYHPDDPQMKTNEYKFIDEMNDIVIRWKELSIAISKGEIE